MTDPQLTPGDYVPHAPYGSYRDSVPIDAPRPPRWYRPGRSLAGAATFTACWSWIAVGAFVVARAAYRTFADDFLFGGLQWWVILVAFVIHVVALRGVVATVRPAIAWCRGPSRSVGGGLALAHALVALAVLASFWW